MIVKIISLNSAVEIRAKGERGSCIDRIARCEVQSAVSGRVLKTNNNIFRKQEKGEEK